MSRKTIAVVLPNRMALRTFFGSDIPAEISQHSDVTFDIFTFEGSFNQAVPANMRAQQIPVPSHGQRLKPQCLGERMRCALWLAAQRFLGKALSFASLVYRFNEIHQFSGHLQKKCLPAERRELEATNGNFVDSRFGFPWPSNRWLFRLLYRLYYSGWQPVDQRLHDYLLNERPEKIVLFYVQYELVRQFVVAAKRYGVPLVGIVGSWDQPTTKGPLCDALARVVVQSQVMREELVTAHGIDPGRIIVAGWPQLDVYQKPDVLWSREDFCGELGIPAEHHIVLMGPNAFRLGAHEPSVAAHIARRAAEGFWPVPVTLVIRPHPIDDRADERFGALRSAGHTVVLERKLGDLPALANQLFHADVVLSSTGTMALDAVALDTPTIGIAFDGDLQVDFYESIARWYEQNHYLPLVESGGVRVVRSFDELDDAIGYYLGNRQRDAAQRAVLRERQLAPLDGKAAGRVVEAIMREI